MSQIHRRAMLCARACFGMAARIAALAILVWGIGAGATASPASALSPTGVARPLVVRVTWTQPDQMTTERMQAVMDGANTFFSESSNGRFSLQSEITPWLTIADPVPAPGDAGTWFCPADEALRRAADAAATARGYDLSDFTNFIYYFPSTNVVGGQPCTERAWAGVGGNVAFVAAGQGLRPGSTNPDGALGGVQGYIRHELGHNLGLNHSNSYLCDGVISGACTFADYGDVFDVMGQNLWDFNAAEKDKLGWLGGELVDGSFGANVALGAYTASAVGPKALKIDTGARQYWIEYRQPVGIDAEPHMYRDNATDGVLVHVTGSGTGADDDGSSLVDMRPGDGLNVRSATLRAGASWTSPEGYGIAVKQTSSAGATVEITHAPRVESESLLNVSGNKRYIAVVQTFGATSATVQVEYGPTSSYGSKTAVSVSGAASSSSEAVVAADLAGLIPGETYHYRAIVKTTQGTTTTEDKTFAVAAPPRVENESLLNVSGNKRYVALVQTFGAPSATVQIEYGLTSSYGSKTAVSDPVAVDSSSEAPVFADMVGLTPGQTYHYRAIIRTAKGTTTTADKTFVRS